MTTTPTTIADADAVSAYTPTIVPMTTTREHVGPFGPRDARYQMSADDDMNVATFSGIGVDYDIVLIGSAYPTHVFDVVASGGPWGGRFLVRRLCVSSGYMYADAYATVCADVLAMVANELRQEIG